MVSAPEDREANVRWTFGERQRGETPMEVFPKGISSLTTAKNLSSCRASSAEKKQSFRFAATIFDFWLKILMLA